MSSPGHRRQRSSQSATPRRSSQRNAIPNSPPDPAAAQLQNEAASSQGAVNGTPRRGVPSSSPMMYRSSPADIARSNRERDISSPLRQMTNTQEISSPIRQMTFTQSPRPSGLNEGRFSTSNKPIPAYQSQYPHRFNMTLAPAQTAVASNRSSLTTFRATAVGSSLDNPQQGLD